MKPEPLLMVPFREVRHDQPDDCLHYEQVAVRGREMDWTIPAHRHEGLHQFQMHVTGQVEGTIDGQAIRAGAPALLLLAPGSVHAFRYSRDSVGHQMTVPSATLRRLLGEAELAQAGLGSSFVRSGAEVAGPAGECQALFDTLAREFHGAEPARVQALLACATLLAVQFLRARGQAQVHDKGKGLPDTLVQRYRALLEAHFRSQQPVSFYAARLAVTPDHLSRTCRKLTGQSALDLLHERLMLEARRLLAYTPMAVAQVAQQLGFDDPAYFSKCFARQVGSTPSAYRLAVVEGVRAAV